MIEKNLWKLSLLYTIRGSLVHIPILVVFYLDKGLSLTQIFILESSWTAISFLFELPSGYLSDAWGRKPTLFLGSLCKFLGMFLHCIGSSIFIFFIGIIFLAIGSSLYSGTMEAMTYDTLLNLKREKEYRHIFGKQRSLQFGSEGILSLFVGWLIAYGLRIPFFVTTGIFALAPILILCMQEPNRQKKEHEHLKRILQILRIAMHTKSLRGIILIHGVISGSVFTIYWFSQPYQEHIGIPLALFGVVHAITLLGHALAAKWTHLLTKLCDDRILLACITTIATLSMILTGFTHTLWGIGLLLLTRICWGMTPSITSDILNKLTTSDIRATILSFPALATRLLFTIISPFLGYIADAISLQTAMTLTGVIAAVGMVMIFVSMRNVWKDIPQ